MFILKKKPVFVLFVVISILLGAFVFPIGAASTALFTVLNGSIQGQTITYHNGAPAHMQEIQFTSRTGIFEPVKNYTREELKSMVDVSEPIRYYVSTKVAVSPSVIERGALNTSNLEAEYTLVSANRTMIEFNVTDYFLERNNNMDTATAMELSSDDAFVASSDSENLVIEVSGPDPPYWDRDATILVTITVTNFGWYPYSYAGYAKAYVLDYYYGYWTVEASGSRYVTFTLYPWQSIQITVLVDTDLTSVGLKRIKGGLNFGWYELLDDAGYNFVQRFSRYEYQLYPPTTVSIQEDVFELPDLYHFDNTTIIRKAGEAVDIMDSYIDTFYEAAIQVLHWVHMHFIYDNNSVVLINGLNEIYRYGDVVLSDTYLLDNASGGYFRGDCSEYTTLYISLTRALNIPTRRMSITLYTNSLHTTWTCHAFAEVWVNDSSGNGFFWMHADPTWDKYNQPSVYRNDPRYYGVGGVKVMQNADDTLQDDDDLVRRDNQIIPEYDHRILNNGICSEYGGTYGSDFQMKFVYNGQNNY